MGTDLKPTTASPADTPLVGTELIPCAQGGVSKALTANNIRTANSAATATQLDVDNVRIDGNTISSTNVNGDINLLPNGTGAAVLPNGAMATPSLRFTDDGVSKTGFYASTTHWVLFASGGIGYVGLDGNSGHVALRSGGQVRWSSSGDVTTGYDLNLYRSAASEVTLGTTAGGISNLLAGRTVEANTAGSGSPNILAVNESRKLLTNEGAGAENYHKLPSAAAGLEQWFYCQSANGIRVVANAGDTIRLGSSVSAAAGFVRSTVVGSSLILVAINATEWVALSLVGTWTVDV